MDHKEKQSIDTKFPNESKRDDFILLPLRALWEEATPFGACLLLAISMVFSCLLILHSPFLKGLYQGHNDHAFVGILIGMMVLTAVFGYLLGMMFLWKQRQNINLLGLAMVVGTIVVGASLFLILFLDYGWPTAFGVAVLVLVLVIGAQFILNHDSEPSKINVVQGPWAEPEGISFVEEILNDFQIPPCLEPDQQAFTRMFYGTRKLVEKVEAEAELQKQKVRYAHYASEIVRKKAEAMGNLMDPNMTLPIVWRYLFGEIYQVGKPKSRVDEIFNSEG